MAWALLQILPSSPTAHLWELYLAVMNLQSQHAQKDQVWWDLQFYYSQLQLLDLHDLQMLPALFSGSVQSDRTALEKRKNVGFAKRSWEKQELLCIMLLYNNNKKTSDPILFKLMFA